MRCGSFGPELVGLSIRNLDNQASSNSVWNLPAVRENRGADFGG